MNDTKRNNQEWRSAPEIKKNLEQTGNLERIRQAAAIWRLLRPAIPKVTYKAAADWDSIISLTPAGDEALRLIEPSVIEEFARADVMMAVFCIFHHHEILIDVEKSDIHAIRQIVNMEMVSRQLLWPNQFGRQLYDRFNDTYTGNRTDHVSPEEVLALLDGIPQGVYQVSHFVSGPLGLLDAPCARFFPPSARLLLWHCSDPGCRSAHTARLLQPEAPYIEIVRKIESALEAELGPASEWQGPLADLTGFARVREPYTYSDISTVIGECVLREERSTLVIAALRGTKGNPLRSTLAKAWKKKPPLQGSAESVAKTMTDEEQLQLLFLLSDSDLVTLVDQCVSQGSIRIPMSEKRKARFLPPGHARATSSELSSLGIRCAGDEPLVDFCALIWDAYSVLGITAELDWRLHNRLGASTQNVLLDYLSKNEPSTALRELVLASEPATKTICEKLQCSIEHLTDGKFIDRLLWKLGFDLPRFGETLAALRRRLDTFNQELLAVGALSHERDRERIRGAGVNLFVSVEEFLEKLICFNVWLLSSDHFLGTRFRYDPGTARRQVSTVLGAEITSGEIEVSWSEDNTNTLGPLIAYLNASANWIKTLPGAPKDQLTRMKADLPDFAQHTLRVFPFLHTELWADSDTGCLERFATIFATVVAKIARSNLATIRNGLDHQRDEATFPAMNDMLAFVAHFREAMDAADVNRLFPKEFWLDSSSQDRFGRLELQFTDYLGRPHVFYGPSFVQGIPPASHDDPVIIAPGTLLGFANADLVFTVREKSVFSRYWEGYPRRRTIPNGNSESTDDSQDHTKPHRNGGAGEQASLIVSPEASERPQLPDIGIPKTESTPLSGRQDRPS